MSGFKIPAPFISQSRSTGTLRTDFPEAVHHAALRSNAIEAGSECGADATLFKAFGEVPTRFKAILADPDEIKRA
ncbi:MAG: hypothetical protein H7203_11565 [Rhizobacter sp.]|nr:hypothetical protein [Burkholderiales bacterium]